MKKLFTFIGSTLGSYAGWWLGSGVGLMTSFLLSVLGLGLGIWFGARCVRYLED